MGDIRKMKADVVVVGTGPGGSTVARDLTLKGKKVIILEWGKNIPPLGKAFRGGGEYVGGPRALGLHRGILVSSEGTMMIRGITTGGSSMMYLGSAYDPDPEMWKPFGFDLGPESDEIKEELHVGPLPDHLIGPGASLIMKAARELGYDWNKFNKLINPDKCVQGCNECIFGCKQNAKWCGRDWTLDAVQHGATLLNELYCDEVIVENKVATGVRATGNGGQKFEISADAVVVSSGGVGTPCILQRSGIYDAGRNFFVDPFVMACGTLKEDVGLSREAMMVTGMHFKEDGIMFSDMMYPYMLHSSYAMAAGQFASLGKYKRTLPIMIKIRDDMDGFVTITNWISKPLSFGDMFKLNKGRAIAREILKKIGVADEDVWYTLPGAAHPGGTCAMGRIVNKDQETEFKNCFVCDASVIPVPFGIPPTLTVMSLGRKLSNHLMTRN